jgi:hypothetical protein
MITIKLNNNQLKKEKEIRSLLKRKKFLLQAKLEKTNQSKRPKVRASIAVNISSLLKEACMEFMQKLLVVFIVIMVIIKLMVSRLLTSINILEKAGAKELKQQIDI